MVTEKMNQTQLSIIQRANLPKHFQVYERRGPKDRVRRREAVGARGSPEKLLKQQTTHIDPRLPEHNLQCTLNHSDMTQLRDYLNDWSRATCA